MLIKQLRAGILFVALAPLLGGAHALAQGASSWVDPPEDLNAAKEQQTAPPADATSSIRPVPPAEVDERTIAPPPAPVIRSERPREVVPGPGQPPSTKSARPAPRQAPPQAPTVAEQPRDAPEDQHATLAEAARALAVAYLDTWSAPDAMTQDAMKGFYAATVRFHGRVMSARALLNEKRRFVERWPERNYEHRPDSMDVSCDVDAATCTVRSVFDFEASNPQRRRRSEGAATLDLVVSLRGERPVIIEERSEVLSRARGGSNLRFGGRLDD